MESLGLERVHFDFARAIDLTQSVRFGNRCRREANSASSHADCSSYGFGFDVSSSAVRTAPSSEVRPHRLPSAIAASVD